MNVHDCSQGRDSRLQISHSKVNFALILKKKNEIFTYENISAVLYLSKTGPFFLLQFGGKFVRQGEDFKGGAQCVAAADNSCSSAPRWSIPAAAANPADGTSPPVDSFNCNNTHRNVAKK